MSRRDKLCPNMIAAPIKNSGQYSGASGGYSIKDLGGAAMHERTHEAGPSLARPYLRIVCANEMHNANTRR